MVYSRLATALLSLFDQLSILLRATWDLNQPKALDGVCVLVGGIVWEQNISALISGVLHLFVS